MKIINLSIVFVMMLSPVIFGLNLKESRVAKAQQLTTQYKMALTAAVQDASFSLLQNVEQEGESYYFSQKFAKTNNDEALKTFFHSLYMNFGIDQNPVAQGVLQTYIPVISIVDYDGFFIYAFDDYTNSNGMIETKHLPRPKIPFEYTDGQGNIISFTLDEWVVAYEASTQKWREGMRSEVAVELPSISLLQNPAEFERERRQVILSKIQEQLEYYINRHNTYAKRYGITYTFTLPVLSQEDWENTIDDIGIISFIQGYPLGGGYEFNNFALGGSRIAKKPVIIGTTIGGVKYYYREDCGLSHPVEEILYSRKEAASKGYFPLKCD
ncbi:hypothetical protein ACFSCX_06525 [Bacillus salitolerans]|uniref:F0F1-type ATP synthase n=1 Tax=Bacillus salitolerans TaxID=1437434 RepID=A0ABW4LMF8_9BACI